MDYFEYILITLGVPFLVFFGLTGNILSIFVFCQKSMRSTFTYLLISLATSDFLFLSTKFLIIGEYIPYTTTSKLVYYISYVSQTCSTYFTIAISWERYQAICRPLQSYTDGGDSKSVKRASVISVIVLLVCLLLNAPAIAEIYNITGCESGQSDGLLQGWWFMAYLLWDGLFKVVLPFVMLLALNLPIFIQIRKNTTDPTLKGSRQKSNSSSSNNNSKAITLLVVVTVFAFCYLPYIWHIGQQFIIFIGSSSDYVESTKIQQMDFNNTNTSTECTEETDSSEEAEKPYFWIWFTFTTILNSSVNFIIYFMVGTKFRQTLISAMTRLIFGRGRRSSNNNTSSTNTTTGTTEMPMSSRI